MVGRIVVPAIVALLAGLVTLTAGVPAHGAVPAESVQQGRAAPVNCSPGVPAGDCPAAADVYNFAVSHNFSPPPGLRGGSAYQNANGLLPAGGDYLEYRLYSNPGSPQRLVIDRADPGANSHYTPDHYASFVQFYLPA